MKKILVLHRYPPLQVIGTNASFLKFLEKLSRENFEVHYLTYKENSVKKEELDKVLLHNLPIYFNRGKNFDRVAKTYFWIFIAPIYTALLNIRYKYDLIYCDDSVPYYGFLTKILNFRTKVVIRLGDLQIAYNYADERPGLYRFLLKIELFMWKFLDGLVPISNSYKKFLKDLGIKEEKLRVVRESINTKNAVSKYTLGDKEVFAYHGALLKCKGLPVLIKAFNKFLNHNENSKLIIAGGGPEEAKLKDLCKSLGCKDKVSFTGWYNHNELRNILNDVSITIAMRSSNIGNNFVVTTSLLENWIMKKPVIVPKLMALEEVVNDSQNGLFFEPDNVVDLYEKMKYLSQNNNLKEKLGENGYKTALKFFDSGEIAINMVETMKFFMNK